MKANLLYQIFLELSPKEQDKFKDMLILTDDVQKSEGIVPTVEEYKKSILLHHAKTHSGNKAQKSANSQ